MEEVLGCYAALKYKHDILEKEFVQCDQDYKKLYKALEGKVKPVNNGRVADLAVGYIQSLEAENSNLRAVVSASQVAETNRIKEHVEANGTV